MNDSTVEAPRVGLWALWFGLFGAPLAWSLQILVNYPFVTHSCFPRREPLPQPLWGWAWPLTLVVSAGMLVLALAAGGVALRSWRATQEPIGLSPSQLRWVEDPRARFMAFSGVFVAALFLVGVVFNWLGLLLVPRCSFS